MDAGVSTGRVENLVCTILGPVSGVNGSGTLVIITFEAIALGFSHLNITYSDLLNSNGEHITHSKYDGMVQVLPPNTPPSPPTVDVTPDSPYTIDELICTVTTPSYDQDGDPIIYIYEWYNELTLNKTVITNNTTTVLPANFTSKNETWKCLVTPFDGKDNGTSNQDQVTILNSPPKVPVVSVTPNFPFTTDDLSCIIVTQSIDPDGDPLTYTYEWYRNDLWQSSENTISASQTQKTEIWKKIK